MLHQSVVGKGGNQFQAGRGAGVRPAVADGRYSDPNVNFTRLSSKDEDMKESR